MTPADRTASDRRLPIARHPTAKLDGTTRKGDRFFQGIQEDPLEAAVTNAPAKLKRPEVPTSFSQRLVTLRPPAEYVLLKSMRLLTILKLPSALALS